MPIYLSMFQQYFIESFKKEFMYKILYQELISLDIETQRCSFF